MYVNEYLWINNFQIYCVKYFAIIKRCIIFVINKNMKDMDKIQKEANEYKDYSVKNLKRTIFLYRALTFFSGEMVNFVLSFSTFVFFFLLFSKISFMSVSVLILFHYFFIWNYFIKIKGYRLVSPEEAEEINEIVKILEGFIENKKPL